MIAIESELESERLKRIHNIAYELVIIINLGVISRLYSDQNAGITRSLSPTLLVTTPVADPDLQIREEGEGGGGVSKTILFGPSGLSLVKK